MGKTPKTPLLQHLYRIQDESAELAPPEFFLIKFNSQTGHLKIIPQKIINKV
jgi:hypothetical protein